MYTLRHVYKDGTQTNSLIGNEYTLVMRFESHNEFNNIFKEFYGHFHVADGDETSNNTSMDCIGFLVTSKETIPINKSTDSYIMTEGGKTFQRIWKTN